MAPPPPQKLAVRIRQGTTLLASSPEPFFTESIETLRHPSSPRVHFKITTTAFAVEINAKGAPP